MRNATDAAATNGSGDTQNVGERPHCPRAAFTDFSSQCQVIMTDHVATIRVRRAESNSAIAAQDVDRVVSVMLADISVSVAGGPVLAGRDASRAAFAEQFADRTFRGYVREPEKIVVLSPPTRATERGSWTGRWTSSAGEQVMRGSYVAEWRYTELGWFIESEVFVSASA